MDKDELKLYLKDNPNYIRDVLESLNCKKIKVSTRVSNPRVQCALPDGDNSSSVHIRLNKVLSVTIYTRTAEFEKKYPIRDIFALVQFLSDDTMDLNEAIRYVSNTIGVSYNSNIKRGVKSQSYLFLKQYKRYINNKLNDEIEEDMLDNSFLTQFAQYPHQNYIDDGVSYETQVKFGISYDYLDNRIITPIRNNEGELLSFKGRTCNEDYKINGIPKFIYYYPILAENYLYGYYENYFDLLSSDEIYIGEAEKFVLQMDTMGFNNSLAVSKKVISEKQLTQLFKLGKSIILCFDNDVTIEEINSECKKFKRLLKVYYIKDTLGLLGRKDSPTDKGKEVFQRLINECKFEYKEE